MTAEQYEIRTIGPEVGRGLFARNPIEKGDFIVEYTGNRIPTKLADEMDDARYLFEVDKKWTIDGEDESNIARYINHSCDPNAESEIHDLPAPRQPAYTVYAIQCENGAYYIGQTQDLFKRWSKHVDGSGAEYTGIHKPIGIVYSEEYDTREEAVDREKWLKTGFGRIWLKREVRSGRARQAGGHVLISAVRHIAEGEEITMDYGEEYYDEFIRPIGCKCGARKHH